MSQIDPSNKKPIHRAGNSGWKQFYLHNRNKLKRKLTGEISLPWMNQKEIDIVWEVLKNRKPNSCLEWGCGFSTLYFPDFLENDYRWLSLEHTENWAEIIKNKNSNPKVAIKYVGPDKPDIKGEGTEEEFKTYIEYPQVNAPYDFILVDGRARKHCVKKATEFITDDGVLLIHDANRKSYLEYTDAFSYQVLFTDYRRTAGGLWIGSKKLPIEDIVDVQHHLKAWKIQTKIGRFLRLRFIRERFKKF